MKKVFIRTFGCQMNEYDSEKMLSVLAEGDDLVQVSEADEADIILFNTCSVREKAQEKVFSDLGRVRPLKAKNPNLIIGVGGCVASQEGEAIVKRAPFVDVVFGPQTLHRLPQMIDDKKKPAVHRLIFPFRKSKNSIICRRRAWKVARHLCRLWKAVPNIAAFAWCLIPAVRNFPVRWPMC